MKVRVADIAAGGVFAVAGALFIASATASSGENLRVDTTGGLRESIQARAAENAELQAGIDRLSKRLVIVSGRRAADGALQVTRDQIAELSPMAGLTQVVGPGVTVTLDDARPPDHMPEGLTGDDYIVHQQDIEGVVNALWQGGASGVTVMGQRLISTSAVRCVGNTVILAGRVYSPPYVIAGVGDVAALEGALADDATVGLYREWADTVGLRYDQNNSDELVLPAYTGPVSATSTQVSP